ncbi:MAG: hypothetical protein PHD04_00800 [Candidatus Pacebacteria bacterium]|nr:hypothetical protein [Candidatus Paceibacterota bacterium]
MPQKRSSQPPEVMTLSKAMPVLAVCVIIDALRLMFEMFWFFGPAIAALYCTVKADSVVGALGGLTAGVCGIAAGAAGIVAVPAIEAFGVVMATATGFAGWLFVGFILMRVNQRIFKENAVWFAGSLLLGMTPLLNALPAMTVIVWKMYNNQIKIEKAALKKYEEEHAAELLQEQRRQVLIQSQVAEQMQVVQREAANDAEYTQKIEKAA